MEIIYRAIDGKEFKNQLECQHHELHLQQDIIMLNRDNKRTSKTSCAFLVWLRNENANLAFHAMAEMEKDEAVKSITKGEDYGLFYWDEGLEEYRWIDPDMAEGLAKIMGMIDERKDV
jgi:hypothetical protein